MNLELSVKVKELRTKIGLSQEELANRSKLSLRTIQRIEKGETAPRGDTLNRLAEHLKVAPADLLNWVEVNDKSILMLTNLSALSIFIFPLLGVVFPWVIWVFKRHRFRTLEEIGKKVINFQVTWCLILSVFYLCYILMILFRIDLRLPRFSIRSSGFGSQELLVVGSFFLFYFYNLCLIILNTIRIYLGKKVYYQPAIRFLR